MNSDVSSEGTVQDCPLLLQWRSCIFVKNPPNCDKMERMCILVGNGPLTTTKQYRHDPHDRKIYPKGCEYGI